MQVLIGADPELFLSAKGKFVSGFGLIPGTKTDPFSVEYGAVQVDGMALEFNITPASSQRAWVHNINAVMATLRDMVPKDLDLVISAVANFDPEYLAAQPDAARMLGCEPDYNAYTGERNPEPTAHPSMRTAAGHVHIGWTTDQNPFDPEHFSMCRTMAIQMDYALGLPAMLNDNDTKRKEMYGQPGAFRPKPYGVEYRVLSNYWLASVKDTEAVYTNTLRAAQHLIDSKLRYEIEVPKKVGKTALEIFRDDDRRNAMLALDYLVMRR